MQNDVIRKLIWSGMLAATGALASIVAHKASELLYVKLFDEEPPE